MKAIMNSRTYTSIMASLTRSERYIELIVRQLKAADYLAAEVERDHELGRVSVDSEGALKAYRKIRKA